MYNLIQKWAFRTAAFQNVLTEEKCTPSPISPPPWGTTAIAHMENKIFSNGNEQE